MKCHQSHPGFELVSPCPFPTTITITPRAPPKLLLPSLCLGFRHEERETQFFYADCSSIVCSQLTDPTNAFAHPAARKLDWPRPRPKNQLALSKSKSQLAAFFKIPKNPSPLLPGMTSFTSPVTFPIRGFYYEICDCHILPACV